ncbi:MAG: bifunctional 4-hydroxy-2-oxoglutarate aldolase/2-dehydro-3-deoxy-phosphogluconate aldolase [Rhodothalassiaceae bacterium]
MSMTADEVLDRSPVIPVLAVSELAHAAPLAQALCAGGLQVLEVTLRTAAGLQVIQAMRQAVPHAIVGAGTITSPADLTRAVEAGAQFVITPGLTPALLDAAAGASVPVLPGVATASELMVARAAGLNRLKLFPAVPAGGLGLLKALHGPFPDVRFCPTGGILPDTAPAFLALPNVACVGGSWLAPPTVLAKEDWTGIEDLARQAAALRG